MNPAVQGLDPKLKETYDRVMGTQLPIRPASSASVNGQPKPTITEQKPVQPLIAEAPSPQPVSNEPAPTVFVADGTDTSSSTQTVVSKKKGFPKVILIALGVLFLGGYTLVWLKVFGVF